jgi:hypothetical protein
MPAANLELLGKKIIDQTLESGYGGNINGQKIARGIARFLGVHMGKKPKDCDVPFVLVLHESAMRKLSV